MKSPDPKLLVGQIVKLPGMKFRTLIHKLTVIVNNEFVVNDLFVFTENEIFSILYSNGIIVKPEKQPEPEPVDAERLVHKVTPSKALFSDGTS